LIKNVLSIAGSDPSGGAGIQADLKTFAACNTYGMAVLTALTAQNTRGVAGVQAIPAGFVADQIRAVFADVRVDAVKIGMIANAEIADAVAEVLKPHAGAVPVVLDPVMIAKGGSPLLAADAVTVVATRLMPLATVVTPNLPEAAALLNQSLATTREEMARQAQSLRAIGPSALVKGGHLEAADSPDVLATAEGVLWFEGGRILTKNTHGTGCTLSSAIAAELAKGSSPADAVKRAKAYLAGAIAAADTLAVGTGHGPVSHFWDSWSS
jgi:hydroxymethylpyrimidine/phosphomethylpyrimidine kinase